MSQSGFDEYKAIIKNSLRKQNTGRVGLLGLCPINAPVRSVLWVPIPLAVSAAVSAVLSTSHH